jgi:hypothetical protein
VTPASARLLNACIFLHLFHRLKRKAPHHEIISRPPDLHHIRCRCLCRLEIGLVQSLRLQDIVATTKCDHLN